MKTNKLFSANEKRNTLIKIAVVCQSCCLTAGIITSWIYPKIPWWWFTTMYYCAGVGGTLTHWAGHYHWSGSWFRAHTIEHHVQLYPPKKFLSKISLGAEDANWKYYFPSMSFQFIATYLFLADSVSAVITGELNCSE
jgi:hypothetical protein